MKKVLILGSTGSIGTQTLEVIKSFPQFFSVAGLSANKNEELLKQQAKEFKVDNIHIGEKGLSTFVAKTEYDIVVNALCGEIGISPTVKAIWKRRPIALANKETLVAAGKRIMEEAKGFGVEIRPVDSEHSAIWQALQAGKRQDLKKIILTCSGGPFRNWSLEQMKNATAEDALKHPSWEMGKKISIDSATLMNKALEVIEAVRLFDLKPEQIEVVIHPESIVHSAVEFVDGSVIAQMGEPDMRTCIAYALSAPDRLPLPFKKFSFFDKKLSFEKVDNKRFPSIDFAFTALEKGEEYCAKMNKANEEAVADFLLGKIGFLDIFDRVRESLK